MPRVRRAALIYPYSVRRVLFHPLAAPILIVLLLLDLWLVVPPKGFGGTSVIRALVWPEACVRPTDAEYDAFLGGLGPHREWRFAKEPYVGGGLHTGFVHLTYRSHEEATGIWGITSTRRRHQLVMQRPYGVTPEDLEDARRTFVQQRLAPSSSLPAVALARFQVEDFTEDHIVYTGYLHNIAALLMIAWLPFALFGLLRFIVALDPGHRIRRGLCPSCAYDRRGIPADAPCPECGARTTTCAGCGRGPFIDPTCPDCGAPTDA